MRCLVLFGLFITLTLFSCKKNIAPENPCANTQETKAHFVIEELVGGRYFEGDTIWCCNGVRFRPLQEADEYIWILGEDTIKQKIAYKSIFPLKGWFDAILIIKRKPNNICFPNDNGMDTLRRKFYVWPSNNDGTGTPPQYPDFPIYGTYYGYNQSKPNHYFYVTIKDTFWKNGANQPAYVGILNGIPYEVSQWNKNQRNNASLGSYGKGFSPKAISIHTDAGIGKFDKEVPFIPKIKGYAWLNRDNPDQIIIEYAYSDTFDFHTIKFNDTFRGNRIN